VVKRIKTKTIFFINQFLIQHLWFLASGCKKYWLILLLGLILKKYKLGKYIFCLQK